MSHYSVLKKKALQAQISYEELKQDMGLSIERPIRFVINRKRYFQLFKACFKNNPLPKEKLLLTYLRLKAVTRLFKNEKVLQTGPSAAGLTAAAALVGEIADLRNHSKTTTPLDCDVAYAGLQAVRLYMVSYAGDDAFKLARLKSATRVMNALNGVFYKYEASDGRLFSSHVYYESQKAKLMKALGIDKDPRCFTLDTLKEDKKTVAALCKNHTAKQLEDLAFDAGACGCQILSRQEWEASPQGQAILKMPFVRVRKVGEGDRWPLGPTTTRGPLSGIKVLDLTHIIAGPASTRLLAEYGAEVLLVRRGRFVTQEQAMLELDGWAGKNSIQLDFNDPLQLAKCKELVTQADVVVSSYQRGSIDKFGLGPEDIHKLNPHAIYADLSCFSDSVWATRPGWAPLAEDMCGISVRNGTLEKPKNLNGVPLDYLPGFFFAVAILQALRDSIAIGGRYEVTGSLTGGAQFLHRCTDAFENGKYAKFSSAVVKGDSAIWTSPLYEVKDTAVGNVYFPAPAIYPYSFDALKTNSRFMDGNSTWAN